MAQRPHEPGHDNAMARKYPLLLSLLLACGLNLQAHASSASDSSAAQNAVERGKQAMQAKDYDTARQDFQEAFLADPTNLDISFYLGQVAFEKGDYETAIMSYERILIMRPDAMRVKLELARCHMRLGSYESAKQYFYEVLAANPPQAVRANIDSMLAAIAASERRHFFSGAVTAGISYDDNSRSAPGSYLFNSSQFNTSFELSSPAQSDYFTTESVVLNHIYRLPDSPFSWKTTAVTFNNLYGKYHDLDVNFLGISSGPAYETENALYEVHGLFNELLVEHDEYMRPAGIGASAILALNPRMMLNLATALQTKRYMDDSNSVKDATNFTIGLTPVFQINDKNRITVSLQYENENASADYWSYGRENWGLRYDRDLPANFTAFAGVNLQLTDYDGVNPNDGADPDDVDQRSDTVTDLSCGLTNLLWQSKDKSQVLLAQMSYTHTESKSNVNLYDYHKNLTAATVTYGF